MTHDPHCPITSTHVLDCPLCSLLKAARDDERNKYQRVWKQNLRPLEVRNYERGWLDGANGRRPTP